MNTATLTVGNGILNIDGTVQASVATPSTIANVAGSATTINISNGATLVANGDLGDGADVLDVAGALNTGGGTFRFADGNDTLRLRIRRQ